MERISLAYVLIIALAAAAGLAWAYLHLNNRERLLSRQRKRERDAHEVSTAQKSSPDDSKTLPARASGGDGDR